jgi:hypothetical protein
LELLAALAVRIDLNRPADLVRTRLELFAVDFDRIVGVDFHLRAGVVRLDRTLLAKVEFLARGTGNGSIFELEKRALVVDIEGAVDDG